MKLSSLSLGALTLIAGLLAAPAARAGGGGAPPMTTPVAGPVEVFVQVHTEAVAPAGFVVADVAIVNSSSSATVHGSLRSAIRFADGTRQALRFPQPLILDPDSTILFSLFVPVPEDAALGEARFGVTAFVGYGAGTGMPRVHVARDTDTFEVVAP